MSDGPQIFQAVTFLLQRIIRSGSSFHRHLRRLNLKGLFGLGRSHQRTLYDNGGSHIQFGDFCKVTHGVMIHDLKRLKKASVVKHDKSEGFGIPHAADPAAYGNLLIQIVFPLFINFTYRCQFHMFISCFHDLIPYQIS